MISNCSRGGKTYGPFYVNPQLFGGGKVLHLLVRDELFHSLENERVLVLQNVIVDDHRLESIKNPCADIERVLEGGSEEAPT